MPLRQPGKNAQRDNNRLFVGFPSVNPVQRDMAMLNGTFISKSHHLLLLTLDEAQQIVNDLLGNMDDFFSYKAGPGNIKDGIDFFHFLNRLTTYYSPAGQLVTNFKALKIRANEYKINGQSYIKITGYPGIRRILKSTRYGAGNAQMVEMAIGRVGLKGAIVGGIKCCIIFSLAWRAIELIFRSDYLLNDFLVDIPMDLVKIIISGVVIEAIGGMLMLIGSAVIIGPLTILGIGLLANIALNLLDKEFQLSDYLKVILRNEIIERQRISEWNRRNRNPLLTDLYGKSL